MKKSKISYSLSGAFLIDAAWKVGVYKDGTVELQNEETNETVRMLASFQKYDSNGFPVPQDEPEKDIESLDLSIDPETCVLTSGDVEPTEEEVYVAKGGVRCPVCSSESLEGGSVEVGAGIASQDMECQKCGASWTDQYDLTGIRDLKR